MWYFTNAGLAAASKAALLHADDESLFPISDPIMGVLTFVPMAAKRQPNSFIPDMDLDINNVLIAAPHMLTVIEQGDWAPDHVQMLAALWGVLMDHKYRSSAKELDQLTWIQFQVEQCFQWHATVNGPLGACDLSDFSTIMMATTCAEIVDDLETRTTWSTNTG